MEAGAPVVRAGVLTVGRIVESRKQLVVDQIPALRRYARALTGNRDAADELVQDCVERAWRRFYLWRRGTNVRTWLFTIMHNLHVNSIRKAKSVPVHTSLSDVDNVAHVQPIQEIVVEVSNLVDGLARLPEHQREVILLVSLQEMTYQEVANVLGIPIGTVMSRLARGRERLRHIMSGDKSVDVQRVK